MANHNTSRSTEQPAFFLSGWLVLFFYLLILGGLFSYFSGKLDFSGNFEANISPVSVIAGVAVIGLLLFALRGFVILEPNVAAVLTFFGRYAGSFSRAGFSWYNPLCQRQKISLRLYNQTTPTLKVNDKSGNPVEVAAVVAWRVRDTARAMFDVEDYGRFITIQSESALRQVVSSRYYDGDKDTQNSLRGDLEAVAQHLADTIQAHSNLAGIEIIEAKIAHLAYAPEIANAMLRRQQAAAVVAARALIVEGAVTMAQMALARLEETGTIKLGEADRVQLVTNLMTVLVSENETQPVLSMSRADSLGGHN